MNIRAESIFPGDTASMTAYVSRDAYDRNRGLISDLLREFGRDCGYFTLNEGDTLRLDFTANVKSPLVPLNQLKLIETLVGDDGVSTAWTGSRGDATMIVEVTYDAFRRNRGLVSDILRHANPTGHTGDYNPGLYNGDTLKLLIDRNVAEQQGKRIGALLANGATKGPDLSVTATVTRASRSGRPQEQPSQ